MGKTKVPGWDPSHVEYLTHHAQEMHGPTDFDEEVQKHLDRLYGNKEDSGLESPENSESESKSDTMDLSSPKDDEGQRNLHQEQEIQQISSERRTPSAQIGPPSQKSIFKLPDNL